MSSMSLKLIFITAAMFVATNAIPTPSSSVGIAPLDCSAISCLLPVCDKGEKLVVPPGQCCPQCVREKTPDCSAISCLLPVCAKGEKLVVRPGQCCPKCIRKKAPDCSAVLCLAQACEEGEKAIVPPGQCCPKCVPRSKRSLENRDCPPTCSEKFCSKNPTAQCSNPGPREIPGCTGSCQLTYCHACYSGNEFIPRPEGCPTCQDLRNYLFDSRCFRRWADCASGKLPDIRPDDSEEDLKCFNPPCPFKG